MPRMRRRSSSNGSNLSHIFSNGRAAPNRFSSASTLTSAPLPILTCSGKVLVEDSNGDRFPSLGTPVVLSEHHNMYLVVFPLVDNSASPFSRPNAAIFA